MLSDSQTTIVQDSPWTGETYTFSYTYNRDGSLASQTYPSGRVIQHSYDGSGRPYATYEPGGGPTYVNSTNYAPHGGVDHFQLGNLLVEQTCYNDRLQPAARRLGDSATTACAGQAADLLRLGFGYGAAAANNGNMAEQTIWAPDDGSGSAWQVAQAYTYDQVNRIATAAETKSGVQQWSRTYAYDHFGNRWIGGATGHTLHAATPTSAAHIQTATNRLAAGTGAVYDAAGNLTAHPFITPGGGGMTYDANNKMTAFAATGVSVATKYDAEGRRVRKVHNGQTTVWVYDAFGKLAAEYTTAVSTDTGVYYRTTDHLGSTRVVTDDTVAVKSRLDYFPFGEQLDTNRSGRGGVKDDGVATYNAAAGMRQKFTGQQRDEETQQDYYWARNYIAFVARFSSIDPQNIGAIRDEPQTWNAYTYVANRSLGFVDPSGLSMIGLCPPTLGDWFGEYDPDPLCLDGHGDRGGSGGGSSDWSVTVMSTPVDMPSFDLSSWSQTGTGLTGTVLSGQSEEVGTDPDGDSAGGNDRNPLIPAGVVNATFPVPLVPLGVVSTQYVIDPASSTFCVGMDIGVGLPGIQFGTLWGYPEPGSAVSGFGYGVSAVAPVGVSAGVPHGPGIAFGGSVPGYTNDPSVLGDEIAWVAVVYGTPGLSATYGYTGCAQW